MEPLRIGVVGCGNICGIYFRNLAQFEQTEVVACADLDEQKARAAADEHGVARVLSPEELVQDPEIDLVLNLTVPKAHYEVGIAALQAGKHLYNEKPLALTRQEARTLLERAEQGGLLVGCAPDTFLGGTHQTCREIIDRGDIGEPVAAQAFMLCRGHESWHPNPAFHYQAGGGPMFDMGPYYLTALVNMLGPIRSVTGAARISFPSRTITSEPRRGEAIAVETPTHIAGLIEFESGALGEITTSFDVYPTQIPSITVFGSAGTLMVPDPNGFGGDIYIFRAGAKDWEPVPVRRPHTENSRGIGVLDMARSRFEGRAHRASGELGCHVLDAMQGFLDSAEQGRRLDLQSRPQRPDPMPAGEPTGRLKMRRRAQGSGGRVNW